MQLCGTQFPRGPELSGRIYHDIQSRDAIDVVSGGESTIGSDSDRRCGRIDMCPKRFLERSQRLIVLGASGDGPNSPALASTRMYPLQGTGDVLASSGLYGSILIGPAISGPRVRETSRSLSTADVSSAYCKGV